MRWRWRCQCHWVSAIWQQRRQLKRTYSGQRCYFGHVPLAEIRIELPAPENTAQETMRWRWRCQCHDVVSAIRQRRRQLKRTYSGTTLLLWTRPLAEIRIELWALENAAQEAMRWRWRCQPRCGVNNLATTNNSKELTEVHIVDVGHVPLAEIRRILGHCKTLHRKP